MPIFDFRFPFVSNQVNVNLRFVSVSCRWKLRNWEGQPRGEGWNVPSSQVSAALLPKLKQKTPRRRLYSARGKNYHPKRKTCFFKNRYTESSHKNLRPHWGMRLDEICSLKCKFKSLTCGSSEVQHKQSELYKSSEFSCINNNNAIFRLSSSPDNCMFP